MTRTRIAYFPLCLAVIVLLIPGCGNPGTWSQDKIETKLKEKLKLTDIDLKQNDDGTYSGTGTTADGTRYTLKVSQDRSEKELKWSARTKEGRLRNGVLKHY